VVTYYDIDGNGIRLILSGVTFFTASREQVRAVNCERIIIDANNGILQAKPAPSTPLLLS
jgi:hypothetical protein